MRLFVLLLLPVIAGRTAAPLLHTHVHSDHVEVSALCNACDIDATVLEGATELIVLPASPLVAHVREERTVAALFLDSYSQNSGRSPPAVSVA